MSGTGYQILPTGDRWSRLLADVTTYLASIDHKARMEKPRADLAALSTLTDPENRRAVDEIAARSKVALEKRDRMEAALMTARARFTLECTLKVKQEMVTASGAQREHLARVALGFDQAYKLLASSKKLLLPRDYKETVDELEAEVEARVAERIAKGSTVPNGAGVVHHKFKIMCKMHDEFIRPYLNARQAMSDAYEAWEMVGPVAADAVTETILKTAITSFYTACLQADEAFLTKWSADLLTFLYFGKRRTFEENEYLDKVLKMVTKVAKLRYS